ncbi:hypothetical protein [Leucobacter salsicius]|uniref:hypothetical protein n=1 Tax=Leucobacter salsicius TaxID=664638 RepID=UPI001E49E9CA|nr:hypothetical protein [Leucobacter salsicius]
MLGHVTGVAHLRRRGAGVEDRVQRSLGLVRFVRDSGGRCRCALCSPGLGTLKASLFGVHTRVEHELGQSSFIDRDISTSVEAALPGRNGPAHVIEARESITQFSVLSRSEGVARYLHRSPGSGTQLVQKHLEFARGTLQHQHQHRARCHLGGDGARSNEAQRNEFIVRWLHEQRKKVGHEADCTECGGPRPESPHPDRQPCRENEPGSHEPPVIAQHRDEHSDENRDGEHERHREAPGLGGGAFHHAGRQDREEERNR